MLDAALHHHEKLTGDGYPQGISEISLLTQIITVSDIFSALTELRAYKKPIRVSEAFRIIREMDGLNQDLVKIFAGKVFDEIDDYNTRQLAKLYRDNLREYGKIIPINDRDIVYMLGDEEIGVNDGVA